jgi:glycosyltransferase involved in cell wall biosynthesis
MPKVSIIVPVYNGEKFLCRCLDSITAQTFTDFEAVLIDDGSTDQSGNICDEYAAKDRRIVVVHKQNEGVAKARITAFEHSKGDFITFVDSDDYVDKCYVEHLYDNIIKHNVDVSCCNYFRVDATKGTRPSRRKNFGLFDKQGIEKILRTNYWWDHSLRNSGVPQFFWSKMIKRSYVKRMLDIGNDLWFGEDQIGVFWLMNNIASLYNSEEPLYYYVIHEGQATNSYGRNRWDEYVSLWSKMLEEDPKGLLEKQKPYKMYDQLKQYLNNRLINTSSYHEFKEEALYALNSGILDKNLFNANMTDLDSKEKINFFLIKNKMTFVYYYLRKIREIFSK